MRVPRSWKDITIAQFQKAYVILQTDYSSPELTPEEAELNKNTDWLAAICGVSKEFVESLPFPELYDYFRKTDWAKDLTTIDKRFPMIIFMRGAILRPIQNFSLWGKARKDDWRTVARWKAGQGIDFNTFAKQDTILAMHKLIAIACKWGWSKYKGSKLEQHSEFIKNMSIATAYPLALFFCTLSEVSLSVTQTFLVQKRTEILNQQLSTNSPKLTHG